mmetsp:Transcript_3859/g.13540  ORF Transcript_3859/g.13540 Transcript_3859/m.13540 type:complete len:201 (+) Transcript_3859:1111-1713(+)
MALPSLTALTMVEKLSSASTMSLASLATSVPAMPIAIPMSASASAGASLTPSPVMAMTSFPSNLSKRMMSCLCLGSARLKSNPLCLAEAWLLVRILCLFSLESFGEKKSEQVKDLSSKNSSSSPKIPMSLQMLSAVSWLSPVITITLIPASWQHLIECFTSGLGGSWRPAIPTKQSLLSSSPYLPMSFKSPCAGWSGLLS